MRARSLPVASGRARPVEWRRLLRAADGPARLLVLLAVVLAFLRLFLN